jgi:hypothetical protein
MSFFAEYFAALDGPVPLSSLEYVADDLEFVIHWSSDGRLSEFTGGKEDLRQFIEAGSDWRGWHHHIFWEASDGDTEFAAGETRHGDGRRIGSYVCWAQLDDQRKVVRYFAARTPIESFSALGTVAAEA